MKKLLGIIFISILGLQGCGDDPVKPQAEDSSKKATNTIDTDEKADSKTHNAKGDELAHYTPALWKIEHQGKTSYLFGSIHLGDKTMFPLPSVVMDAYESSDTLAVEIDLAEISQLQLAKKVQDLAKNPENPLDTVLSQKTLTEYQDYCQETQSPCQMFSSFEPWFAAMTLEALSMQKAGYQPQYGIDGFFLGRSRETREIVELETIEFQLSLLDGLPLHLQDAFLYSVVTSDLADTHDMVDAWKTGQVEKYLEQSFDDALEAGIYEEDFRVFMDELLYKRNRGMAEGIAQQIEQGKSVFAVVGAAHYGGEKSVNHYLEEKGFTVQRIDY